MRAAKGLDVRSAMRRGRLLDSGLGGVFSASFREAGLLVEPSEVALSEVERLDIDDAFLLGLSDLLKVKSGAEAAGGAVVATVVVDSVSRDLADGRCGILICASPVDFLEGGGPRMESPWLLRLRIS